LFRGGGSSFAGWRSIDSCNDYRSKHGPRFKVRLEGMLADPGMLTPGNEKIARFYGLWLNLPTIYPM